MNITQSILKFLSLFFLSNFSESAFVDHIARERILNYWDLTRHSDVVICGTITNIDTNITIAVSTIYKGTNIPKTISFTTPPSGKEIYFEELSRFITQEKYIVFLLQNEKNEYTLNDAATGNIDTINSIEQVIFDILKLDSLENDFDKCKMLISLMSPYKIFRSYHAYTELSKKYNKAEFFDLFYLLENEPLIRNFYINLLENNQHPSATIKLRELLQKTQDYYTIRILISSLRGKNVQDNELSRELLQYISHDIPEIRREVIFAIGYRNYFDALPEITTRLNDEASIVRASALRYVSRWGKEPEIFVKIKNLTYDKDEEVRAAAYDALMWDTSQVKGFLFYKFLLTSLLDKSEKVRKSAGRLDMILEKMPFRISLLLLWPGIAATGLVFYFNRKIPWPHRIKIVIIGVVTGYISGAAAGLFIGLYHIENPLFHSLILIPPLFIPVGILFLEAVTKSGRRKTFIIFSIITALTCVIVFIITLNNTLWPGIILGLLTLSITGMLLSPKKLRDNT